VIVVDTDTIDKKAPTDPSVEMLVALARATGHQLFLPAVAWDEYTAHYKQALAEAYESLVAKVTDLQRLAPHWRFDVPGSPAMTAAMERNTKLQERFTPAMTPAGAPAEGLRREIERIPPAADGRGARDTVIWLTALDKMAAVDPSDELLIFYSKNVGDFTAGKSEKLHPVLVEEVEARLGDAADRFRYCGTLEALLNALEAAQVPVGDANFASVAASPNLDGAIVGVMARPSVFFELASPWSNGLGTLRSGAVTNLVLQEWRNAQRLKVAEVDYLVFSGTWTGEKMFGAMNAVPGDTITSIKVTFGVDATIVAQLDSDSKIAAVSIDGLSAPRDVVAMHVTQRYEGT